MIVTDTPQQPKIDRDKLPSELKSVPEEHLDGVIKSAEKALAQSAAMQKRKRDAHEDMVRSGKTLDVIGAAKRCYTSGSAGNEDLRGDGPAF